MSADPAVLEDDDIDLSQPSDDDQQPVDDKDKPQQQPDEMRTALADLAKTQKTILERTEKRDEKPPEMTAEQKAEFWAVYDPEKSDKEFFQKWFRLNPDATAEEKETVKGLFASVQEGLVRQSVKGSKNYTDYQLEQIKQEFAPIRAYVEEARAEATRGRFFKGYPTLNETKFEKIIQITARQLAEKNFADEKEYFKTLAEGVAETIKGVDPTFDLGKQQQPAGKAPKLPRTSVGGGGGAGKGRTSEVPQAEDHASEVLDD